MGKKKSKKTPMPGVHDAEFSAMLDGVASILKAISMLNRNENVTVTVSSFSEQVILPEVVRSQIIGVLTEHYETVKPYLTVMAKGM